MSIDRRMDVPWKNCIVEIVNLYPGAWRSALVISIEEHVDESPATDMRAG
jgi:hypothetical protein